MNSKANLKIAGMSCAACAARIEKGLLKMPGVESANVNLAMEWATIQYDDMLVHPEQFDDLITKLGYQVLHEEPATKGQTDFRITGMTCAACSARIEKKLTPWREYPTPMSTSPRREPEFHSTQKL